MKASRSARIYADFLLPHLTPDTCLVDVGCGTGELSLEMATSVRRLIGIDVDEADIETARGAAKTLGVDNADFVVGNAYALDLDDGEADAVFGHSILEALDRPGEALLEMARVAKPGGLVAAASVEYGGLILGGPHESLLRRFYAIREHLWLRDGADPFLGRRLRGLFITGGLERVEVATSCLSYGTAEAVEDFGRGRADDCANDWYVSGALEAGLATSGDLAEIQQAWLEWSLSPEAYAAFAWCRAIGWKPRR